MSDLISRYLSQLPPELVEEIAGDLAEAVSHYRSRGMSTVDAERAAIEEFGPASAICSSYRPVAAAGLAQRWGLGLVATGPTIGALWVAAAFLSDYLPHPSVLLGVALTVVTAASCAMFAVVAGPYRAVARSATVAACAAIVLDLSLLTLLVTSWPPHPVALVAAAASLARLPVAARGALRLRAAI